MIRSMRQKFVLKFFRYSIERRWRWKILDHIYIEKPKIWNLKNKNCKKNSVHGNRNFNNKNRNQMNL